MIRKIILSNFMSHKHTEFDISNNVTVLVGQNGNGKSAIFHAIRWVFTNEPRGSEFIFKSESFVAKKAAVTIITENGDKIIKERTGTSTKYIINDTNTYHKTEVPDEIYTILGIDKVTEIGDTKIDLNFMFQMDAPFLLSESGGKNAIILSSIAGTESLDLSYSETNKQLLANTKEKKSLQQQKEMEVNYIDCLNQYNDIDMNLLLTFQNTNTQYLNSLNLSTQYFNMIFFKDKTMNFIENIEIKEVINIIELLKSYSSIKNFKQINKVDTINEINTQNNNFNLIKEYNNLKPLCVENLPKIEFNTEVFVNILLESIKITNLKTINTEHQQPITLIDTSILEKNLKLIKKFLPVKSINVLETPEKIQKININEDIICKIKELFLIKQDAKNLESKIETISQELEQLNYLKETKFKICPLCGQENKEMTHIHG